MKIVKNSKKRGKKDKLTPRNLDFIRNYTDSPTAGNATQSYIAAKYSSNGAQESASKLLSNPIVMDEVERIRREIAESYNATPERIIRELAHMAFIKASDVFNFYEEKIKSKAHPFGVSVSVPYLKPPEQLSEAAMTALNVKETPTGQEIKMGDKQKALESLVKYVGLNNDAEITRAKEIKSYEQTQEIEDPLAGMTVEEIEEEIKKIA